MVVIGTGLIWYYYYRPSNRILSQQILAQYGRLAKREREREMRTYFWEVSHHFLHQWFHWCNIDDLKLLYIDCLAIGSKMLAYLTKYCQQSNICLTSTLVETSHMTWINEITRLTVGAHIRRFSSELRATLATLLCIRLRDLYVPKASCAHDGRELMGVRDYKKRRLQY